MTNYANGFIHHQLRTGLNSPKTRESCFFEEDSAKPELRMGLNHAKIHEGPDLKLLKLLSAAETNAQDPRPSTTDSRLNT